MNSANHNPKPLCSEIIFNLVEDIGCFTHQSTNTSITHDDNNNEENIDNSPEVIFECETKKSTNLLIPEVITISSDEEEINTETLNNYFNGEEMYTETLNNYSFYPIYEDEDWSLINLTTSQPKEKDNPYMNKNSHHLIFEDEDWPVNNYPESSPPKPRRINTRRNKTAKNLRAPKVISNVTIQALKSCLKNSSVYTLRSPKHVKFNPIGSLTFIPSNYEKEREKYIKTQSLSKTFKEYPYHLNLKVNRSVSKPKRKYAATFSHQYVPDNPCNPSQSTVNTSPLKLSIKSEDIMNPGKPIHAISNRWPRNDVFSVNMYNEPFGEMIPNFVPKPHVMGPSSSIDLPEVVVHRPLTLEVYLNHHSVLDIDDPSFIWQPDAEFHLTNYPPRSPRSRSSFLLPQDFSHDLDFSNLEVNSSLSHADPSVPNFDHIQRCDPVSTSITQFYGINSPSPEPPIPIAQSTPIIHQKTVMSPTIQISCSSPKTPITQDSAPIQSDLATSVFDIDPDIAADLQVDLLTTNSGMIISTPNQQYSLDKNSLPNSQTYQKTSSHQSSRTCQVDTSVNLTPPTQSQMTPTTTPIPDNTLEDNSLPSPNAYHKISPRESSRHSKNNSQPSFTPIRRLFGSSAPLSQKINALDTSFIKNPSMSFMLNTKTHSNRYQQSEEKTETYEQPRRATITIDELRSSNPRPKKSRSNHHVNTPALIDESISDCINPLLGQEFYDKHPWVDTKSIQFAKCEYAEMISSMGSIAAEIIDKYAEWFAFIMPKVNDDRKGWSVTKNGITYVSTSVAYRPGTYFINKDTVLELCLICEKIITHKFAVICAAIIWKENYTGKDLVQWTHQKYKRRACYCHFRDPSASLIEGRNPYKIKNRKKFAQESSYSSNSNSEPQLGPSVLPINFI